MIISLFMMFYACKTSKQATSKESKTADSATAILVFQEVEEMQKALAFYPEADTLLNDVGNLVRKHEACLTAFSQLKLEIVADSNCQLALKGDFFDVLYDYDLSMAILNTIRRDFYPIAVVGGHKGQNPYGAFFDNSDPQSVFICLIVLDQLKARLNENGKAYLNWLQKQGK